MDAKVVAGHRSARTPDELRVLATLPRVDTIGELISSRARLFPDRIAIKDRAGTALTYAQLDRRTSRLAGALARAGLGAGDRVAAWMTDGLPYVELYVAAAKASVVVAPINARFRAHEAHYQLGDAQPGLLVVTPDKWDELSRMPGLTIEVVDDATIAAWAADGAEPELAAPDPDQVAILGYTSGTTGRPKGAMLTHRGVTSLARSNVDAYRLVPASIGVFSGSMSFVSTVPAFLLSHFTAAGTVVLAAGVTLEEHLDLIAAEGATYTSVPGPRLKQFARLAQADPSRVRTLRSVLHGAAKASADDLRAVAAAVGHRLIEGYGMTENSGGLVTATDASDFVDSSAADDVFASVGRPLPGCAVEVRDEHGVQLAHDGRTVGELVIRTPHLFDGYWNLSDASAEVLVDGWYRTGDLGMVDRAGYVYVVDRRPDLIVSGGMNVYPSEVEHVIAQLDGVVECAVIGYPHERWGQSVGAVVVKSAEAPLDEHDVIDRCRAMLAGYKKPTRVWFVEALPRNTGGKVLRTRTRELVLGERA